MSTRVELFWEQVDRNGPVIREELGPCWVWTGARSRNGYGTFYINGSTQYTHRIAYALAHGQVGRSRMVCHRCDNPPCVRIDHLYDGRARNNLMDAYKRKRRRVIVPLGEQHPSHKLTEKDVAEIRRLAKLGKTQQELSRAYHVNQSTIQRVLANKTWKGIK